MIALGTSWDGADSVFILPIDFIFRTALGLHKKLAENTESFYIPLLLIPPVYLLLTFCGTFVTIDDTLLIHYY